MVMVMVMVMAMLMVMVMVFSGHTLWEASKSDGAQREALRRGGQNSTATNYESQNGGLKALQRWQRCHNELWPPEAPPFIPHSPDFSRILLSFFTYKTSHCFSFISNLPDIPGFLPRTKADAANHFWCRALAWEDMYLRFFRISRAESVIKKNGWQVWENIYHSWNTIVARKRMSTTGVDLTKRCRNH